MMQALTQRLSVALAVTTALAAACHRGNTRSPLDEHPAALTKDDLPRLREFFNESRRGPRMIAFLTPGCGACVPAAKGLQALFDRTAGPFGALIVWEPVPGNGLPEIPPDPALLALIQDKRARQVWDPGHLLSTEMYEAERRHGSQVPQAQLRTDKRSDGVLYDAVALFSPESLWDQTLPAPTYVGGGISAVLEETEQRLNGARGDAQASTGGTVTVPAGPFEMGTSDEKRRELLRLCGAKGWGCTAESFAFEPPRQQVDVPQFEIDRLEVSNEQYDLCVRRGGCPKRDLTQCSLARRDPSPPPAEMLNAAKPAVCVTWSQAAQFCTATGGRLPTETEWEKAARGSEGREFPWGNDWDPARANWGDEGKADGYALSAPVGSFPSGASPYGALDMAGNVWEWVASSERPEFKSEPGSKPTRGGGFAAYPLAMRPAKRALQPEIAAYGNVGFRCAR